MIWFLFFVLLEREMQGGSIIVHISPWDAYINKNKRRRACMAQGGNRNAEHRGNQKQGSHQYL